MAGTQLRAGVTFALLVTVLLFGCLTVRPAAAEADVTCGVIVHPAGEPPQAPLEPYVWRVRADGVGCARATRVVRRYMKQRRTGRWICGSTHFEMGCRRGSATVHLRALRPIGRGCGKLGFEPNSDNVAVEIRASRVSCATARTLVRAVYDGTDRLGFRCRSKEYAPRGLPYVHWVCHRDRQRVRWIKA